MTYQETLDFTITNKETIINEMMVKMKSIFIYDSLEDNQNQWWTQVVEPGWDPPSLEAINVNSNLEHPSTSKNPNELIELIDEYYKEAITNLNMSKEIIQL